MGLQAAPDASRLAEATRAVRALVRAERIVRTYPPGNDLRERTLRELRAQLAPALPLDLRVLRGCLAFGEHELREEGREESELALRLYRDGVRRLELHSDLAEEELSRLITTLATPIHPDDLSEDYVTLLWGAELRSVRVVAVDPYLALDVPDQVLEGKEVPRGEVEGVELDGGERDETSDELSSVPPPPEEAFRISRPDAERIAQEIDRAESTPPWESFIDALFDLLRNTRDQERVDDLAVLLEATVQRLLDDLRLELAAGLLERLQGPQPALADGALRRTVERVATADRIEPLRMALEAGACSAEAARSFLRALGERAPALCCELLARSRGVPTQRFFVQALIDLGPSVVEPVLAVFQGASTELQSSLTRVLAGVRDPRATRALIEALIRGNPALRREAVRSLIVMRDPDALHAIMKAALGDPDSSVRLVALRVLGQGRAELDCSEILAVLDSNRFQTLGADEKDLLFETLGAVGNEHALDYLRRRLRPGWMPGRADSEDWTRAARALVRMGTEAALEVLAEGARSRRRTLAFICEKALQAARKRDDGD